MTWREFSDITVFNPNAGTKQVLLFGAEVWLVYGWAGDVHREIGILPKYADQLVLLFGSELM